MCVSIIVPAYNTDKFLAAALESVLSQTRKDWELIVVNDGSTDKTGTIAEAFSQIDNRIRVVHQENTGIAGALNRGFTEIGGDCEYCMMLGSDDVLKSNALEILIHALEKDHTVVAAHGLLSYIDSEGKPLAVNGTYTWPGPRFGIRGKWLKVWPISSPTTFEVLAYHDFIPSSGIIMRRAKKEVAGGFDQHLKVVEDWDMWLRLSRLGDIAFVNSVVYSYRIHRNNISKNRQIMRESELYVRKKMYTSADLDEQERRIILFGYRYKELVRAFHSLSNAAFKLLSGRGIDAFKQLQAAMRHISSSFKGDL
jgi:glycosyltransferase involved in cell wall biosynthesis